MKEELQLLENIASLEPEARKQMLFSMPKLLAGGVHERWEELLREYSGDKNEIEHLQKVLADIVSLRKYLENHPSKYPIGYGPVEQLMDRIEKEEISREQARELARKPNVVGLISFAYVLALCLLSFEKLDKGFWRYAVDIQMILLAILDYLPDTLAGFKCTKETIFCALEVVTYALNKEPDGEIYKAIVEPTQRLLKRAQDDKNDKLTGELLFRLGTLHLDSYTADHNINNYQSEKGMVELKTRTLPDGSQELYRVPVWADGMPSAKEALEIATNYLKQAIRFYTGNDLGRVLKALAQTLYWRQHALKEPIDNSAIRSVCEKAKNNLDLDSNFEARQYVEELLQVLGV